MKTRYSDRTQWIDTTLSLTLESFHNYTQCLKLHTECKSTLGVFKKTQCNKSLYGCKTTHSVYVYTECKSTLGVCVNCDFITLCIFTHTEATQCEVLHTVCNYEIYTHCRRF